MDENNLNIFLMILSGIVGYIVSSVVSFYDAKKKVYSEVIPVIVKFGFRREKDKDDEKNYSEAVCKLWLYGSKKVCIETEKALDFIHNENRGNKIEALKKSIIEMRNDIQIWSYPKLKIDDFKHIYTMLVDEKDEIDVSKIGNFELLEEFKKVSKMSEDEKNAVKFFLDAVIAKKEIKTIVERKK